MNDKVQAWGDIQWGETSTTPADITRKYDVLNDTDFKNLMTVVEQIPYTFQPYLNHEQEMDKDKSCYFATTLFNYYTIYNPQVFELCKPLLEALDVKALFRMKINLYVGESKFIEHAPHRDTKFKSKAFVYYLNTNNGYTKIGDTKIPSRENCGVILDGNTLHQSTNCTDQQKRLTLNLNYF
jgi:hypothetical protein